MDTMRTMPIQQAGMLYIKCVTARQAIRTGRGFNVLASPLSDFRVLRAGIPAVDQTEAI